MLTLLEWVKIDVSLIISFGKHEKLEKFEPPEKL